MTWRISTELVQRLLGEAASSPAVEVCGLLLGTRGDAGPLAGRLPGRMSPAPHKEPEGRPPSGPIVAGTVTDVRPCRNVTADPSRRFEIDPAALLAAHRHERSGGPAILGCYHSHPSGRPHPSPRDAADAAPNGWLWLIVAQGEVRAWRAIGTGRWHGRFDEAAITS